MGEAGLAPCIGSVKLHIWAILDTLADLPDPGGQEEFISSPFTTCYLKLFKYYSKKPVRTIQVNVRS